MRRVLPTAAGLLVSMATGLLPAGSASATTSAACGPNSRKIITSGLKPENKVWIDGVDADPMNPLDTPVPSRVAVCVVMNTNISYSGGLTIVFDAGSGVITPPGVDISYDPAVCGNVPPQWDSPNPDLALLVNPATRAVCIRTGDPMTQTSVWLSVQFASPSIAPGSVPTLEVWKDGGDEWGFFDAAACHASYVLYLQGLETDECLKANMQVFPPSL